MTPAQYAAIAKLAEQGPSRELDARIWCAKEGVEFKSCSHHSVIFAHSSGHCSDALLQYVPQYSRSLDAALTCEDIISVIKASMYPNPGHFWHAKHEGDDGRRTHAEAKTEPLARRLAALKAMVEETDAPT